MIRAPFVIGLTLAIVVVVAFDEDVLCARMVSPVVKKNAGVEKNGKRLDGKFVVCYTDGICENIYTGERNNLDNFIRRGLYPNLNNVQPYIRRER